MKVIIVGAGEVGRATAKNLQSSHTVSIVDHDPAVVEELTYTMDVLPVSGDGTEIETLRAAGIEDADIVIACTDDDEANIVICGAAKTQSDAFTIARIRRRGLLETWERSQGAFGVDFMICMDLMTARAIFRISGLPAAQDVDIFAGGLVRMAEFNVTPESRLIEKSIEEIDTYDSLTFAGIFRNGEITIPTGESIIYGDDRVIVIGTRDAIETFSAELVTPDAGDPDEVVIVGGSEIGFQVAREFESHGYRPRLIEKDPDRARELAESLPETVVLESDGTDTEFLATEHVDEADVVIAALDGDEKNLLVSLLARRIGVDRTIAVIENLEYADLFETVGVDVAVNPREETAEEIVRFTRADLTEQVAMLENDRAEVIEKIVDDDSLLVGRTIQDAMADLPDAVVIGAISRGGEFIQPRGETVIEPGDHVVVFLETTIVKDVLGVL
ncbi:Trk system potassium transporter TrkA [Natrialbaceae archaeon A-chndr2]